MGKRAWCQSTHRYALRQHMTATLKKIENSAEVLQQMRVVPRVYKCALRQPVSPTSSGKSIAQLGSHGQTRCQSTGVLRCLTCSIIVRTMSWMNSVEWTCEGLWPWNALSSLLDGHDARSASPTANARGARVQVRPSYKECTDGTVANFH
jgi:hypothetical protein